MVALARGVPDAARRRLPAIMRAGGLPLVDQGLISLGNFVTSLIVARTLSVHDFGIVTLALTVLFAANTLQGALVVGPLGVLSADRDEAGTRRYTATAASIQAALVLACAVLVLGSAWLWHDPEISPVLVAIAVALIGWQVQEFGRRILYVNERIQAAVLNDLLSYGGQVLLCAALALAGLLTPVTALLAIGLTSAAAGAIGLWLVRPALAARPSLADATLTLRHGAWLAAGEVAQFISARLPAFVTATLVSVAAAGVLGAALLVLNPLNVIMFSIWTVVPMRIARAAAQSGPEAADRMFRRIYLLTALPVVVFCVAAMVVADPLLEFLYGAPYRGYGWLVVLVAVFSIARFHAGLLLAGLWARRQSRAIFVGHLVGAAAAVAGGVALVAALGLAGAAVAMIVATLVSTFVYWRAYRRGNRHDHTPVTLG